MNVVLEDIGFGNEASRKSKGSEDKTKKYENFGVNGLIEWTWK